MVGEVAPSNRELGRPVRGGVRYCADRAQLGEAPFLTAGQPGPASSQIQFCSYVAKEMVKLDAGAFFRALANSFIYSFQVLKPY